MSRHVIIGNGIAGVNAAESIRAIDPDGAITMIARETFPPYSRPMIGLVLQGAVDSSKLPIRDESWYRELHIEPLLGEEVTDVDVENKRVTTNKGSTVSYDKLLIASGADPRPIKAEHSDLGAVFYMRTESHVHGMVEALPGVKEALVLGGGLVGFKAAYGLMHRGVKVTMLIKSGYPLSMQLDPVAGGMVLDELLAKGLDVRVNIEVVSFEGNGTVRRAHLSDGSALDCQMVVIGKGVLPANSFAPRDKIKTDLGILVDENFQTSAPDVYAAGDVVEAFDVAHRTPWVNAIWPVAVDEGRVAGLNMAGRKVAYAGAIGRNVMRIFDLDVLTGGVVNPQNGDSLTVMEKKSPLLGTYRRLVFRDDVLVGVAMVGKIERGGVLISVIQRGLPLSVDPELLLEPSFNYGQLIM